MEAERNEKNDPFQLLILDIRLEGKSGLTLAKELYARNSEIGIVFMTNYREYAEEGYDAHPIHFLVKPIDRTRLTEAIRIDLKRRNRPKTITLNYGKKVLALPMKEIYYIESRNHHIGYGSNGSGTMTVRINGGSVKASSISNSNVMPQNSDGTKLSPAKITGLSSFDASTFAITNADGTSYPYRTKDMQPIDGTLYLYVPSTVSSIKLGDTVYICNQSGVWYAEHDWSNGTTCVCGEVQKSFHITVSETVHGTVHTDKTTAVEGETVTLTVNPDVGYKLASLTMDGSDVTAQVSENTYRFTMPVHNVIVTAQRTVNQYPVTFNAGDGTFADGSKEITIHVDFGAVPVAPATPILAGYNFDGWTPVLSAIGVDGAAYTAVWTNKAAVSINEAAQTYTYDGSSKAFAIMIVTILWHLEGQPVVNYAMSFNDVAADTWYTEAVRWAQANKIVSGYSDNAFGPGDVITREQLATILYRYEQYKGGGFTGAWMIQMDYVDLADVSDWAYEAM